MENFIGKITSDNFELNVIYEEYYNVIDLLKQLSNISDF